MNTATHKSIAYTIVEKLWRLNRIFCSSDYDTSIEYLKNFLPFEIHEFKSDKPFQGWEIPPKWDLVRAQISHKGKIVYEADHPLRTIGLSSSFKGTVTLAELKAHLHFDHRNPANIPFHFRQHYRPWKREWGFCVTKEFYDSLTEGEYQVEILTKESPGYLKVAEYVKEGETPAGFAFVAHLDHPGMANDDLSGVAVGVELFHRLSQMPTKFTYRLVIVQEIIGSVFYLNQKQKAPILESCFIEMLGTKTPLAFQHSRKNNSLLETILQQTLAKSHLPYRTGAFRTIACNDDVVWESHNIPMCSLCRFPYPEYHSDKDNLSIIFQEELTTSVDILYDTIQQIEKQILIEKAFKGVFSLAHPQYDLYIDVGQPAFSSLKESSPTQLRVLMDEMPLLPHFSWGSLLAKQLQMPEEVVLEYLKKWQAKGLLHLI